jgi:hypothetical protein
MLAVFALAVSISAWGQTAEPSPRPERKPEEKAEEEKEEEKK